MLEYKPKFEAAAIYVPIGFSDEPEGPYRPCDAEARDYVGWPRRVAIQPTPSRAALHAKSRERSAGARAVAHPRRLPPLQVDAVRPSASSSRSTSASYFAAHPDLTFAQLNNDQPLTTSPYHEDGVIERMNLIRDKMPGVEEIVTRMPPPGAAQVHMVQATGLLWTARRAAGRAMQRLPMDPNWDSAGMRMELVR